MDAKGYFVFEDYSSFEEVDDEPSQPAKKRAANPPTIQKPKPAAKPQNQP
jgi:hypothetical protein